MSQIFAVIICYLFRIKFNYVFRRLILDFDVPVFLLFSRGATHKAVWCGWWQSWAVTAPDRSGVRMWERRQRSTCLPLAVNFQWWMSHSLLTPLIHHLHHSFSHLFIVCICFVCVLLRKFNPVQYVNGFVYEWDKRRDGIALRLIWQSLVTVCRSRSVGTAWAQPMDSHLFGASILSYGISGKGSKIHFSYLISTHQSRRKILVKFNFIQLLGWKSKLWDWWLLFPVRVACSPVSQAGPFPGSGYLIFGSSLLSYGCSFRLRSSRTDWWMSSLFWDSPFAEINILSIWYYLIRGLH